MVEKRLPLVFNLRFNFSKKIGVCEIFDRKRFGMLSRDSEICGGQNCLKQIALDSEISGRIRI